MTAFDDYGEIAIAPASFYKLRHQRRDGDTVLMAEKSSWHGVAVKAA
jgi:hypothetical protein